MLAIIGPWTKLSHLFPSLTRRPQSRQCISCCQYRCQGGGEEERWRVRRKEQYNVPTFYRFYLRSCERSKMNGYGFWRACGQSTFVASGVGLRRLVTNSLTPNVYDKHFTTSPSTMADISSIDYCLLLTLSAIVSWLISFSL